MSEQFTCPECGSHHFGTSNCTSPSDKWVGHCHGYIGGQPCRFSWPRTDDSKYFSEREAENYKKEPA